jgi:predicted O-methyltransferase YrrM
MVIDWKSCRAINAQTENEFINEVLKKYHTLEGERLLRCLEIGSFQGLSAAMLAQYGIVFCIDLWANLFDCEAHYESITKVSFNEFVANMVRLNLLNDRVFPIISSSVVLTHMEPMLFDVIYIDANHDYVPVCKDIERVEKHLSPSGILIFHDYKRVGDRPDIGVNQAVDELLAQERHDVYDRHNGCIVLSRK